MSSGIRNIDLEGKREIEGNFSCLDYLSRRHVEKGEGYRDAPVSKLMNLAPVLHLVLLKFRTKL